jgi:hypothetical protein
MIDEEINLNNEKPNPNEHMNEEEKKQIHKRYLELKSDFNVYRERSKNTYDYYNLIEKSILDMED